MIGGFIASFIISQIIAIGGYYANTELSYVLAFTFFIVLMFVRPRGSSRDDRISNCDACRTGDPHCAACSRATVFFIC